MTCPCGHPLTEATRTLRLIPDGQDPVEIPDVAVRVCKNCTYTVATEATLARVAEILEIVPGPPWPRCRVFPQNPDLTSPPHTD